MGKCVIHLLFFTWLLTVSLSAETKGNKGYGCSSDELSNVPSRYAKYLQNRVLNSIIFARPDDRSWLTRLQNFKRNLLLWGFYKMDRNKNGLVDYKEAALTKWSLRGSRVCKLAFIQQCDEDQSKAVSRKEWLNCFKITPACNKSCARGKLDQIRCECRCPERVIQRRVLTISGTPLRDATILLPSFPYTLLARTNNSGHFSMIDSCEDSSYTVKKDNYVPVQFEGGITRDHPFVIHLEDAEPASITVHPKSKTRIVGQSVNFTCEADGTAPIRISWYRNGTSLLEESSSNKSHLFIASVNTAQGFYTCQATNDYGSEISNSAVLKIKEDILDTCNRAPSSHMIQLPSGCTDKSTGKNTLDVGRCSEEPCSQSTSFSQSCGRKEDCCCGPRGEDYREPVEINCGDDSGHNMGGVFYRIQECGCSTCVKRETVLQGKVVGGPDHNPVENVKVIFRKKVVDKTNEEGTFSFTIPDDVDRVTVTFQDPTDQYVDTTQTMPFQRGQTVFHRIALQEEDPPVTFDSSQDLRVPLGHTGDNMAELELPADNLLYKDGKPFKGKAKLRVSLTDPRNASDLFSAPGDFTTVDQSGSVQPLKTYGILRIKVQDHEDRPLNLAGNMKVYLDADKISLPSNSTGEMAPWLWWLDEKTGRWRQIGEMKPATNSRTKRQLGGRRRFYIGDIPTDKLSVINIDILWKRCYVRTQAYTMTDKGEQPVSGAVVTLIGRENTEQEQYYGFTNDVTNSRGIACIPAWCDSDVFLQSKMLSWDLRSGSEHVGQLIPDQSILDKLPSALYASIVEGNVSSSFKFTTKISSHVGPIFGGDEKLKCLDPDENLLAFQFHFNGINTPKTEVDEFGSWPPGHPLSWYTKDASKPDNERTKCFVKVSALSWGSYISLPIVMVQSFTPNFRRKYGFSIRELTPLDRDQWPDGVLAGIACVEYRCSAELGRETLLAVSIFGNSCGPIEIPAEPYSPLCNPSVVYSHLKHTNASIYSVSIYAPVNIFDGKLGLYTGPGKIAEQRCLAGRVDDVGTRKEIGAGFALRAVDDYCEHWRPNATELCQSVPNNDDIW